MLIRFVISNFLSFDKEVEFNMLAGSFRNHNHHVYKLNGINVLKGSAIYGANGSGKSNLVKAFEFFQDIVTMGKIPKSINDRKFKLDSENKNSPISFEIEFKQKSKKLAYGIVFDNNVVLEEWLYEVDSNNEDKLIFERKNSKTSNSSIKLAEKFVKSQKIKLLIELLEDNLLQKNELLIGKASSLKIKEISAVTDWFTDRLLIIHPHSRFSGLVQMISSSESFKTFANDLLEKFDTGVSYLSTENTDIQKYFGEDEEDLKEEIINDLYEEGSQVLVPSESGMVAVINENGKYIVKKVISYHKNDIGQDVKFDLNEESDGTQRLLDFIPAFDLVLQQKVTIIIDEIDHSLHPNLLCTLIQKIMADETTKGQLIFTTHESSLLDLKIFRQDEIWFTEKNRDTGGSEIYSLSEYKPRYDLDIRKGYLKGRFGAIPFLTKLVDINWQSEYNEEEKRV